MTIQDFTSRFSGYRPSYIDLHVRYSVLIPLIELDGRVHLLFEVRADKMRRQPGEICFPGGKIEDAESPIEAAVRELEEELSIPSDAVSMIGPSDRLLHHGNALIYPFLAKIDPAAVDQIQFNPDEVKEVFLVPADFFEESALYVYSGRLIPQVGPDFPYKRFGIDQNYPWRAGRFPIPVYHYKDRFIWGMTARIIHNVMQTMSHEDPS